MLHELKETTEQKNLLHLMSKIADNPVVSQRTLASELGIALGLMNTYLKRCMAKGWVRVSQVSPKRLAYFLTPEGFSEKSRMVSGYLSRSLTFFRDAKTQCEEAFSICQQHGWKTIGLYGAGDLADIAMLVGKSYNLTMHVLTSIESLLNDDAILITDIQTPQSSYDTLKLKMDTKRLLVLDLLHISRERVEQ